MGGAAPAAADWFSERAPDRLRTAMSVSLQRINGAFSAFPRRLGEERAHQRPASCVAKNRTRNFGARLSQRLRRRVLDYCIEYSAT